MNAVDRLTKLTSQLVGDIARLPGVQLDSAGESQLVQLLTDAFEVVGHVALEEREVADKPASCIADNCGFVEPHYHSEQGVTVI